MSYLANLKKEANCARTLNGAKPHVPPATPV